MKDRTIIPLLGFVKFTGLPLKAFYMRPKFYHMDPSKKGHHLPKKCIVMSNHTSLWDFPLYLGAFYFQTIHFVMGEVLFRRGKLFGWFLYSLGGIYVDRDQHSFNFVRDCLKYLDKGKRVGIFPQGRLPVNGRFFPYMPGVTVLALKTDAPIIPLYTDGNYGLFKPVRIMIGEPIYIRDLTDQEEPDGQEIKRLTRVLEEKTLEMKAELERRLSEKH